jgi:hypothetical protein
MSELAGLFKALSRRERLQETARDAAAATEDANEWEDEAREHEERSRIRLIEAQQSHAAAAETLERARKRREKIVANLAEAEATAEATAEEFKAAAAAEAANDQPQREKWREPVVLRDGAKAIEWHQRVMSVQMSSATGDIEKALVMDDELVERMTDEEGYYVGDSKCLGRSLQPSTLNPGP